MTTFKIKIKLESDALIGSGESYGALIDSDIVYDNTGLPYIPAKRVKGLLKDSLENVFAMFAHCGLDYKKAEINDIFGKIGSDKSAEVIFSNLYVEEYSDNYKAISILANKYPDFLSKDSVINYFTSIRHQIKINEKGTTADKSLRTIRVLNRGAEFFGEIIANENQGKMLSLACKNLRYLGTKRNKGLGYVKCELTKKTVNIWGEALKELEELCQN